MPVNSYDPNREALLAQLLSSGMAPANNLGSTLGNLAKVFVGNRGLKQQGQYRRQEQMQAEEMKRAEEERASKMKIEQGQANQATFRQAILDREAGNSLSPAAVDFFGKTPGAFKVFQSMKPDAPPKRDWVTGPDNLKYYTDTQERVLPGVEPPAPAPEPMEPDAAPDVRGESGLRKEYNSLSSEFKKVKTSYGRITASSDTAAGDIALIFNFMKMLDPSSVVRESEYATAANAAGVPDRIRVLWKKVKDGQKLSPDQRTMFKAESKNQYATAAEQQREREAYFTTLATDYGFDSSRIVRNLVDAEAAPAKPDFAALVQDRIGTRVDAGAAPAQMDFGTLAKNVSTLSAEDLDQAELEFNRQHGGQP